MCQFLTTTKISPLICNIEVKYALFYGGAMGDILILMNIEILDPQSLNWAIITDFIEV